MKKTLSITGSIILASSAVTILATNITTYQTMSKKEVNSNINWSDVNNSNTNYFKNIKENCYKRSNSMLLSSTTNKQVNMDDVFDYAQNTANNYIKTFENKNINNLDQILSVLSKDNPEFAKNYKDTLFKKVNTSNLAPFKNVSLLSNNNMSALEKYVQDLKISKTTFITVSAVAAVAAAGFWAAAWFFGISIPWATGSTIASAVAGAIAAGISIVLVKYDEKLSGINKAFISFGSIFRLGHIFYAILNPLLIGATATATSVSWAFPAILAIIPIVSTILAWINLFN